MGRTLVANRLLAGSACGKRQRGRPLNAIVSHHLEAGGNQVPFPPAPPLWNIPWQSSGIISCSQSFAFLGLWGFVVYRVAASVILALLRQRGSVGQRVAVSAKLVKHRPWVQFTQPAGRGKLLASWAWKGK